MLKRETGNVHTRSGAGSSIAVVVCSLCPLQNKRHCSISPPPQFADRRCLEIRRPALLLGQLLTHNLCGYYTSEEREGPILLFNFSQMLE